MSDLESVKKLRSSTGAGFKDCNSALKEASGDLEKAIEILRIKGVSEASKKMSREANEGLVFIYGDEKKTSIIEINCETDFVAKNDDFLNFTKEIGEINNSVNSDLEKLNNSKMKNGSTVSQNLIDLIAKIGEKITIRRSFFFDNDKGVNFFYVYSSLEKNIGKIVSIVKLDNIIKGKNDEIGSKIAMHIAASNPIALNSNEISKDVIEKEEKLILEELKNSGKPEEITKKK